MEPSLQCLLDRQDCVVTAWQAAKHLSVKAVRHRVHCGRWRRLQRGVYLAHAGRPTAAQREWAAILGAGGDRSPAQVGLAGLSALCGWGLTGIDAATIEVLVPHGRQVQARPGVTIHRTRDMPELLPARPRRPLVAPPGRALFDAVRWAASSRQANLIVARAFQQKLVRLAEIERVVHAVPNARHRRLLLKTAADCAAGSHSLGELDLLGLCHKYGLPTPRRQAAWQDRRGRTRYLDALFEPWNVAVEVDGAHHAEVAHAWDDALRANALELQGFVLLRYPSAMVRDQGHAVAEEIRTALVNAGWQPPPPGPRRVSLSPSRPA